LVNSDGKLVETDYAGKKYRLIAKKEWNLTSCERLTRGFIGVAVVVATLGLSLLSKSVRNLFSPIEKVRYAIPMKDTINGKPALLEVLQRQPEVFFFNDHISRLPLKDQVQLASLTKKVSRHQILKIIFQKHFPTVRCPEGKFNEFYSNFNKAVDDSVKGDWKAFEKTDIDSTIRSLAAKSALKKEGKFKEVCQNIFEIFNVIETSKNIIEIFDVDVYEKLNYLQHKYIDKFLHNFPYEKIRIEIAKIVASRHGRFISEHIQAYEIKNESALIEIAKIAAMQDGK